ncbi:putative damage-inducible protein DinB [Aeromicrobium panaciterrae]|uniref:Damage-inducible protein DinB n=1 Tax=Aeromicrobium panaciterrae TaxID=363861 RepID=A0ABU1ULL6_9ACTN|nr:DinB family protein [Aeromicrobium panaciterrae]MDR7086082.1 putative damage-inducible protein DinB [Aeromicrobium panaciterrae]
MPWTAPAIDPVDGPLTGPDRPILETFLQWERATLLNICAGLTGEQLALQPVPPSNLSLLGLVRHMAKVERTWFRIRAGATGIEPLYDLSLGKDYDFEHLVPEDAPAAFEQIQEEWRLGDEAVADLSFDHSFKNHGEDMSLRMTYVHMIGEYARHNGHADILRQAIDGVTGR